MIKTENKSFTELVTSNFPSMKEQETLVNEMRHSGFLDVFEVSRTDRSSPNCNELEYQWGCFLCNHPEKAVGFLHGTNQPMIEGQLKEKKGKWRLFRRWRTRYFTLSGAHLSCKGSVSSIFDHIQWNKHNIIILYRTERRRKHRRQSNSICESVAWGTQHPKGLRNIYGRSNADSEA